MPTRNINLTDYYDKYLTDALASGRFKNASEAVRAGLRLLEYQQRQEEAKLEALRGAFREGQEAIERGEFTVMESDADIDRFFDGIDEEIDRTQ